jgi:putative chitinase
MTIQQLQEIMPDAKLADLKKYIPFIDDTLAQAEINTPKRIAAFISQVAEESINFHYTLEIASGQEYEGRHDLGNVLSGDGQLYKGRGLVQITGRNNYKSCSLAMYGDTRLITTPSLLEQPEPALRSACWYWNCRNLNLIADKPEDWFKPGPHNYSKTQWITVLVNGGLNGYNQRLAYYNRARKLFNF